MQIRLAGRKRLLIFGFILMISAAGCSNTSREKAEASETAADTQDVLENTQANEENLKNLCLDLYEKAAEENKTDDLEMIRNIVNRFGENGYPAVDSKNQIDMTQAEQVLRFCESADAAEEAEITIIEVDYFGGFITYDLQTEEGKVDVVRSYYKYENESLQKKASGSYQAENWEYTKEGYLMFSGIRFSEDLYVLTMSETKDRVALRVLPLDERCRELNRKYLLPVGYERNNMFLMDWSEPDFGSLNFYDLFDVFYPNITGEPVPYTACDDLSVRSAYRIPKDEFENVIMTYFNIDSESLQSKTVYDAEDAVYEYKPRGFQEREYPEYPYPEVTGYAENSDGTVTLTVNVVFPYTGNSKVYAHEVTVRPLGDGGVHYVSNRIIPSEDNCEETWHTPRLPAEE